MIIIKYFEWMKLLKDERHPVYEICDKHYKCRRQITREEPRNSSRSMIFASSTAIMTEQSGNLDFGTLYAYSKVSFSYT